MRVLHLHWTAQPVTGGVEAHMEAVTRQLSALPCDIDVVAGTREAPSADYDDALALDASVTASDITALVGRCAQADVVHWHNPQWHKPPVVSAVVAALQQRSWRGEFVFDLHNIDEQPDQWEFLAGFPADWWGTPRSSRRRRAADPTHTHRHGPPSRRPWGYSSD